MKQEELIKIISDLFRTNKFVEARLNLMLIGDEYGSALIEKYKKQLYKIFNPSNIVRAGFSLERAQIVLSDFADICGYGRWYGDLALYFAECATDFTMSYGDINEKFYDALGDAYHDAISMDDYITGEYYSIPWIEKE